jgi:hypothetical protein
MMVWRHGADGATSGGFFQLPGKFRGLLFTLRDQIQWLDVMSLTLAGLLILLGLRGRGLRLHPALGLAAAIYLVLVFLLPSRIFGSVYADIRLWPIVFIAALVGIAPIGPSWRPASVVAAFALGLFALRIVVTTVGFNVYANDYVRHLRALDYLPQGASIAVLTPSGCQEWRQSRLQHLDSLAIVRRDAFVNSEWEIPGAQLLTPLRGRGTAFNADPSGRIDRSADCAAPVDPALTQRIGQIPADRFDYVWLLGFDKAGARAEPDLKLLYADDQTALYALAPAAAGATTR